MVSREQSEVAKLAAYDYELPAELIATTPASPRDAARLLVYDRQTGRTEASTFTHLADYVPPRSVLVFNETKVIPARLPVRKVSGGKVELLYVRHDETQITVLANKPLAVGMTLTISPTLSLVVAARDKGEYQLTPNFSLAEIAEVLEQFGEIPLPPYLKHSPLTEKERKAEYQSVFARRAGSVAAPTASLHFTSYLLNTLRAAGMELEYVTLHVNLGTFAPVTEQQLQSGQLHEEQYLISTEVAEALNRAKREGRNIIAVGTTVARTLESAATATGEVQAGAGVTRLFIQEGYTFKFVDGLITNFHVPRSSLLMLVAALITRSKLFELYAQAIAKRFRFFSFGDGMLIR